MNKQEEQTHKTHKHGQQYGGYQREGGGGSKRGQMGVMEEYLTLGGKHTIQNRDNIYNRIMHLNPI